MKRTGEGPARTPAAEGFRMPAEWEPHAATWLAWPHNARDWPGKFGAIPWAFAEIARAIARSERVRLLVRDAAHEAAAKRALAQAGVDLARVEYFRVATDRGWTRDMGPIFVVRDVAGGREVAATSWRFDGWAKYPNWKRDDAATVKSPLLSLRSGWASWDQLLNSPRTQTDSASGAASFGRTNVTWLAGRALRYLFLMPAAPASAGALALSAGAALAGAAFAAGLFFFAFAIARSSLLERSPLTDTRKGGQFLWLGSS